MTTEHCRECGDNITENSDKGLCLPCAKEDQWIKCSGCNEAGWAGCDNMFTFSCKLCDAEICECCSSNSTCADCETKHGIVTIIFGEKE